MTILRQTLIAVTALALCPMTLSAQSTPGRNQQFIESSSPVKGGGTVTSRYEPGARMRTVTSFDRPSPTTVRNRNGFRSNSSPDRTGQMQSVLRVAQSGAGVVTNPSSQQNTPAGSYPYPAANRPRTGFTQSQLGFPGNTGVAGQRSVYQVPTLGILSTRPTAYRTAQNCAPCNIGTNYQSANYQSSGAALSAPSLNIEVPGESGFGTGTLQTNPYLSNQIPRNSAYQPLFRLQNMPPGTYLGQGIVGQPTAYVDGQPIRNLLRYISP